MPDLTADGMIHDRGRGPEIKGRASRFMTSGKLGAAHLHDLGVSAHVADDVLWRICQQRELLLVTANRNEVGPDSLGATTTREGTAHSLPVLTIAERKRLLTDGDYCRAAAARMIEIIEDLELLRGSGRLWLP